MNDEELLAQKYLVETYLNKVPRPLSSFAFVAIFAWADFLDFEFKVIKDALCIFAKGDSGIFLYLPPLGKILDASTLELVFQQMAQGRKIKAVNRIENIPENLLSAFGQGSYNQYPKPEEYVYRKGDLIALKGNAYKSKRHDCHLFANHHAQHSFEPYALKDIDSCMRLFDQWAQDRSKTHSDDIYRSMLQENRLVHARLLKYAEPLGLIARVLKVDGKIIGYTFGYAIDEETFCVYAEIAELKHSGVAAYMFQRFCADDELRKFSRINTMDDFAMPNITKAKQSYHPSELISSYTISIKSS